ncbi:MAG: chemotaxis protein CheW [Novipirellula sp. JB048]
METEILVFECGGRHFGVDAGCVRGVLRAVALTHLPQAPEVLMGLLNLRGRMLAVLDTSQLLGLGAASMAPTDHLIVVDAEASELALHVDRAVDLLPITRDRTSERDPHGEHDRLGDDAAGLISMVAKTDLGVVPVLAVAELLQHDAMHEIVAFATSATATQFTAAFNF